jgi:hypothetical protein
MFVTAIHPRFAGISVNLMVEVMRLNKRASNAHKL